MLSKSEAWSPRQSLLSAPGLGGSPTASPSSLSPAAVSGIIRKCDGLGSVGDVFRVLGSCPKWTSINSYYLKLHFAEGRQIIHFQGHLPLIGMTALFVEWIELSLCVGWTDLTLCLPVMRMAAPFF